MLIKFHSMDKIKKYKKGKGKRDGGKKEQTFVNTFSIEF